MAERGLPDLKGRVRIDTSELDRIGGRVSGALGSLGAVAAKAGAAIAAGGAIAAGFGLQVAASNEQALISFETMLGSAEKARAFLGELKQFAATTPFEFPELRDAASRLIAAGVEANKVIPIMTSLGNATSGMGTGAEGVQRATVALQQMAAAGRITGEDLNQLRDAGIPVFDLLAAATGKSVEEVAKLAQTGKLGRKEMEQLFEALESGKGLERFNGLMEKQSQSLLGLVSTLKDTVGEQLGNLLAPAVDGIKAALPDLTAAIDEMLTAAGPGITSIFDTLLGVVSSVLPTLGPIVGELGKTLAETFEAIRPAVEQLLPAFAEIVISLLPVMPALAEGISAIAPAAVVMAEAFADLIDALPPGVLAAIVGGFVAWNKAIGPMIGTSRALRTGLTEAGGAANLAAQKFPNLASALGGLRAGAASTVRSLASVAAGAARSAAAVVAAGARIVASALRQAAAYAVTAAGAVAGFLATAAAAVASAAAVVAAWIVAAAPFIALGLVIAGVVALIIANWDTIVGATKAAWNAVTGAISAAAGFIRDHIGTLARVIVALMTGGMSEVVRLVVSNWDRISSAFSTGVSKAVGFVRELPGKAVSALSGLGTALFNVGQSAMESMARGLRSIIGKLLSIAGEIKDKLVSKLNPANWFSTPEEHYRMLWGDAFASIGDEARKIQPRITSAVARMQDATGALTPALTSPVLAASGTTAVGITRGDPSLVAAISALAQRPVYVILPDGRVIAEAVHQPLRDIDRSLR